MKEKKIKLIKVHQWLESWLPVNSQSSISELGRVPEFFYLASISLKSLRMLAGVHTREKENRKSSDKGAGYQRSLEASRAKRIAHYIKYGFPLSTQTKIDVEKNEALVHPGWLPTSILINVLKGTDTRRRHGKQISVSPDSLVRFDSDQTGDYLLLPDVEENFNLEPDVKLQPIEIIDGQHRVFAVDHIDQMSPEYEVPVVVFDGLSEAWQAYLFWVINVEPKRINPSLAFDLYPELRTHTWLEGSETIKIYRESRAQELTETLWRYPYSVWHNRIELFGSRVSGHVSNASFIRSLTSSFLNNVDVEHKSGGLFGASRIEERNRMLPWKRVEQSAFLILCWKLISDAVEKCQSDWCKELRGQTLENNCDEKLNLPVPLIHGTSLLATDQGVRTVHYIFNIFCIKAFDEIKLEEVVFDTIDDLDEENIAKSLNCLNACEEIVSFLKAIAETMVATIDWRTSSAHGLTPEQRRLQSSYRGSAGYTLLRNDVIQCLINCPDERVSGIAKCLASDDKKS